MAKLAEKGEKLIHFIPNIITVYILPHHPFPFLFQFLITTSLFIIHIQELVRPQSDSSCSALHLVEPI
jgi:hypothetical protein